jgi:hypothetical protein
VETVRLDILTVWDQIRFTFRNRQKGDRVEIAQLEAHAFIKRFLLHILPSGFVRVRHYGFLANRCKAYTLPLCRQALGQVVPPRMVEIVGRRYPIEFLCVYGILG